MDTRGVGEERPLESQDEAKRDEADQMMESQEGNRVIKYSYAEGTVGFEKTGFYGSLTYEQTCIFDSLRSALMDEELDLADFITSINPPILPILALLRFLRANNWSLTKTLKHIRRTIEWRKEMKVRDILAQRPEEILDIENMEQLLEHYPHYHRGFDELNRPVLYKKYSYFKSWEVIKYTSWERLQRYHIWEQEAAVLLANEQTLTTGKIVETFTAVLDVGEMRMNQATRDFIG
jgi:hypothetical protein